MMSEMKSKHASLMMTEMRLWETHQKERWKGIIAVMQRHMSREEAKESAKKIKQNAR